MVMRIQISYFVECKQIFRSSVYLLRSKSNSVVFTKLKPTFSIQFQSNIMENKIN